MWIKASSEDAGEVQKYVVDHPGAIIGGFFGLICNFSVYVLGLFKMLVVALFVLVVVIDGKGKSFWQRSVPIYGQKLDRRELWQKSLNIRKRPPLKKLSHRRDNRCSFRDADHEDTDSLYLSGGSCREDPRCLCDVPNVVGAVETGLPEFRMNLVQVSL